jgi:arsenate reductase
MATPRYRLYHNPRCSKSRETLALLRERGVQVEVVEYLKSPPDAAALDRICRALGAEPTALVRTKEKRFDELGLSLADARGRDEWLALLAENPILLERPILVAGRKAAIGRPPENVLPLLD